MPAYSRLIDRLCAAAGCSKRATHEVRNGQNSKISDYCKRHADEMVASLNR